jgi:hypothetical protein
MVLAGLVLVVAGIYYAVSALLDPPTATTGLVLALGVIALVIAWMLLDRSSGTHAEVVSDGEAGPRAAAGDETLPQLLAVEGAPEPGRERHPSAAPPPHGY